MALAPRMPDNGVNGNNSYGGQMDLMSTALNRPIKERLSALADELGEDDVLGLALSEIRRHQVCLREHRIVIADLLAKQGVTDWVVDPGASIAFVPVSLSARRSTGSLGRQGPCAVT
jgi:hypothetical protein